jgi:hypothetical protein
MTVRRAVLLGVLALLATAGLARATNSLPIAACRRGHAIRSCVAIEASTATKPKPIAFITFMDGVDQVYQLDIQDTSGVGYVKSFSWTPPPDMSITQASGSGTFLSCDVEDGALSCVVGKRDHLPPGRHYVVMVTMTGTMADIQPMCPCPWQAHS